MIEDKTTTTLYLSSLLPIHYPMFWNGFKQALEQNNIKYLFLEGTKDIRVRDYMPVQVTSDKFVQFQFKPDYYKMDSSLQDKLTAQEDLISQTGLRPVHSEIILDGGNVVKYRRKAILTSKVFLDNPEIKSNDLINRLKTLLEVDQVVIIPVRPVNETGHSNGTVRFIDENKVLMGDHRSNYDEKMFADGLYSALLTAGMEIIPVPNLVPHGSGTPDNIGNYMQFVQVGHIIFVPQYGTNEDRSALDIFEQHFTGYKIVPVDCTELAKGSGLHGISWNIFDQNLESTWEDIFEKKRQQLTEELQNEMDAILNAKDDFESPTFKKREKYFEIGIRLSSQVEHLRPNSLDPNYSVVLANSYKKELAKDFYYEWKASTSKQRFMNNKAANFVKKVVPEMRQKFRHYMKNHTPNYTFTYQPDFIDASNEEILNFLAEYTAYMDFIVQLEQELEQGNKEIDAEKNIPYNYSKLALLFHFYLKSIGIDTETMLKSSVARFIHLLFCIPYTDLKKTKTIYDKLRAAPLVTKDDTLVEYLSEVKNQFQKYDLNDAASLIDVYLTESIKEKNKKN